MKKNIFLLFSFYCIPMLSNPYPKSLSHQLKNVFLTYGNHMILEAAHAAGHSLTAQIGLALNLPETTAGKGSITYALYLAPTIKLPLGIQATFPEFKNNTFMQFVDLSGPAAGLLACYLKLKIANIYSEYSSKKTFIQNIKDGLAKPFYKGHSKSTLAIVGLHTLKNSWQIIPGNHTSYVNKS